MWIKRFYKGFHSHIFCTNKNCKQPKWLPLGRRSTVPRKWYQGGSGALQMFYVLTWVVVTRVFSCTRLCAFLHMFGILTKNNLKYIEMHMTQHLYDNLGHFDYLLMILKNYFRAASHWVWQHCTCVQFFVRVFILILFLHVFYFIFTSPYISEMHTKIFIVKG